MPGIWHFKFDRYVLITYVCSPDFVQQEVNLTHPLLFHPILFCRITNNLIHFFSRHAKRSHDFDN